MLTPTKTRYRQAAVVKAVFMMGHAVYTRSSFPADMRDHASAIISRLVKAGLVETVGKEERISHFQGHDVAAFVNKYRNTTTWLKAPDWAALAAKDLSTVGKDDRESREQRVDNVFAGLPLAVPATVRRMVAVIEAQVYTTIEAVVRKYELNEHTAQAAVDALVNARLVTVTKNGNITKPSRWHVDRALQVLAGRPAVVQNGHNSTSAVQLADVVRKEEENTLLERIARTEAENTQLELLVRDRQAQQKNADLKKLLGL